MLLFLKHKFQEKVSALNQRDDRKGQVKQNTISIASKISMSHSVTVILENFEQIISLILQFNDI